MDRPLLGPETGPPGPPCAISVPNLMSDRGVWVAVGSVRLNVRRLMYQSLIWSGMLRNDARRLASALDSQRVKRLANALVDGVGGDVELCRDFFRRQMLIDQPEAVELTGGEPGNTGYHVVPRKAFRPVCGFRHARPLLQCNSHPRRHAASLNNESSH